MICPWAKTNPLLREYHDKVWGKPCHDDHLLFEYLVLESFQAGLSWLTILKKQAAFEEDFYHFDVSIVAKMTENDVERLLQDDRIIRHRRKIENAIAIAKAVLKIQEEWGSLDRYIWSWTNGETIVSNRTDKEAFPVENEVSRRLSKDLKQRGCRFVGSVTCYAYLQGIGVLNDHVAGCPSQYEEVRK